MRDGFSDEQVEKIIGGILRAGVIVSTIVVLAGGIGYVLRFGGERPDFTVFRSEPAELRSIPGIVRGAMSLDYKLWIQLGLVLLIATPVVRVFFSIFAFIAQKDPIYVAIALTVAGILLYSLFGEY
jgi:uncharacterized membrane protein